ncbi:hypothetical protein NWE55_04360 [Myroides albus]|uniref:hypothetical protein n=1 Tax=Myroides albus TaxID=2562892 RepID=UPI002159B434|nr:hypothetical protein [Myroides albus]UVD80510.1 hypothetical protein NWE55_04360 [Myroides albus]
MKKFIYFALTVFALGLATSCTSDDNSISNDDTTNPTKTDLTIKVLEQKNDHYNIAIYSNVNEFYAPSTTPIIVEITDATDANNKVFTDVSMNIMMHMTMPNGHKKSHSAPISQLKPIAGSSNKFEGEIMFSMAGMDIEKNFWEIEIKAKNKDKNIETKLPTTVRNGQFFDRNDINSIKGSDRKTLETFNIDSEKHFAALHHVSKFIVGKNNIAVSIYKREDNGMRFPEVGELQVSIDPRMPDMANHGVLDGVIKLNYNSTTKQYEGKLPLSMTGYWFLNLVIKDQAGNILAGQPVGLDADGKETVNGDKFFDLVF